MHHNEVEFLNGIAAFLGGYYIALALINGIASLYVWRQGGRPGLATLWAGLGVFYVILSPFALSGSPEMMRFVSVPLWIQDLVNQTFGGPVFYSVGTTAALVVMFLGRKFFVQPVVAWIMLNLALLAMGFSMTNPSFSAIVTKPDNVPIVGLVFLLGYFTWLSAYKAVINEERMERGEEPLEKLDNEKVLVWPDLVYTEMICMVALTAFLIVWAICLPAPLEEAASSVKTPNPSKAPWYFLGLQEMLVYYDPWMAGVVLPSMVLFGLIAIPYIDFNREGSGYYTINQRKFAYVMFQIGFLEMWVTLIVLGTFLRGPNWNFFGPYEIWDAHKVEALNNVDLSEYFWVALLNMGVPQAPEGASMAQKLGFIFYREAPGILLLLAYFTITPPLLAITVLKKFYVKMGFLRFMILANLLMFMALLPIKMVLRWSFNLKYIVHIEEYFLNF